MLYGTQVSPPSEGMRRQQRAVRNVVVSCVAVLLLGQLLIGLLSLAALVRLGTDSTADRLTLIAGRSAGQIQAGLQLGKPLTQYFGLPLVFDRLQGDIPELLGAAVVLDDGTVLASVGQDIDASRLLRELAQGQPRARQVIGSQFKLALPLAEPNGGHKGALVIAVKGAALPEGIPWAQNLWFLAAVTGVAAFVMVLAMRLLPVQHMASAGWLRMAVPVAIMLVAQGIYTVHTVQGFRTIWQSVLQENARLIGEGLERDLEKVLSYGVEPERMQGVERPMSRAIRAFPLLGGMEFVSAQGIVLARTGVVDGREPVLNFPLEARPNGPTHAWLRLYADDAAMRAAVRGRALDAATIAVVAMVAAIELMLMLQVLMDRAFSAQPARRAAAGGQPVAVPFPDDPSRLGMVARPVMFAFLFAMALPLGFLPLYARSLLDMGVNAGSVAMLVALPTAAEMAAGLVTALLAGRLIDRRGWVMPVAWGLGLAVLGNLACALAGSLWMLTAARVLAGLGYGLVWMALQGFVVNLGLPQYRGRNMTALIAGLFAGHMTGAAVGGMLASQIGQQPVFVLGALMVLSAAVALRILLWPYRAGGAHRPAQATASVAGTRRLPLRSLLADPGYTMLLLGSVVPFSIAQVGLLSYALPLYFDSEGATTADVGRVIMLYGFCVIYLGPLLGRATDQSRHWKHWITAGGVVGASGLVMLQWAPGLWGMVAAVVLLAVASCLAGAAQTPYMLARERALAYGPAGATGFMRAADKFGQMLGPLMVGALFAAVGMSTALVWTGAVYMLGTLLFWLLAPRDERPASPGK
jgi:Arabinose efflux permease